MGSLAGDSQPTITVGAWLLYDVVGVPLVGNPDSGARGNTRRVAVPQTARVPAVCIVARLAYFMRRMRSQGSRIPITARARTPLRHIQWRLANTILTPRSGGYFRTLACTPKGHVLDLSPHGAVRAWPPSHGFMVAPLIT